MNYDIPAKAQAISRKEFKDFIESDYPMLFLTKNDNLVLRNVDMENFISDRYYTDIDRRICLGSFDYICSGFGVFNYYTKSGNKAHIDLYHTSAKQYDKIWEKLDRLIKSELKEIYNAFHDEACRLKKTELKLQEGIDKIMAPNTLWRIK